MRLMFSESRAVEAGPEAVEEWTSEGGLNGRPSRCRRDPTRYPSGAYDGTRSERTSLTSIWVVSQKLTLLSQKGDESVFCIFAPVVSVFWPLATAPPSPTQTHIFFYGGIKL